MWAARFVLLSTLLGAAAGCDCERMLAVKRRDGAPTARPGVEEPSTVGAAPPPEPPTPPPASPVVPAPPPPPVVVAPPPAPVPSPPVERRFAVASDAPAGEDEPAAEKPVADAPPPVRAEKFATRPIGRLEQTRTLPPELLKGSKLPAFRKLKPLRFGPANGAGQDEAAE